MDLMGGLFGGEGIGWMFTSRDAASRVPSTGGDHCPTPAGHTIPDTRQDAVSLLGHPGTLLCVQWAVNQHPQSFSTRQLASHSSPNL